MKNKILLVILVILPLFSFQCGKSLNFVTIGDWGREGKFLQKATGEGMSVWAEQNKCDFVLALGDNYYETGVRSVKDSLFKTCFEDIYTQPSLQIPWYAVLGNHDYGENPQAQIEYSAISKRWKMPARYYTFEKTAGGAKVLFVMMDSNPFIENYKIPGKNSELNDNSVEELKKQDTNLQLKWLDSVLNSTDAKWKIVCAHHPVYSGGKHKNNPELIEKIRPLLIKYKVQVYLAGHDHDLQYLKDDKAELHYFVSGAGSQLRETHLIEQSKFAKDINGFTAFKIFEDKINAEIIDLNGNILYSVEIK